jgi:V8-like Glu-specific endopeptidase
MGALELVTSPHLLPFRRICSLLLEEGGRREVATGWFFGNEMLVTAGHVFTDFGEPQITVWPGRNNQNDTYFGVWTTRRFQRSMNGQDYAAIYVPQPVGESVGTFGIATLDQPLTAARIEVAGYSHRDGGVAQWSGIGPVVSVDANEIQYEVLTETGQSGAPVWIVGDHDYLVGLHVADDKAIRFTEQIVQDLLAWRDGAP